MDEFWVAGGVEGDSVTGVGKELSVPATGAVGGFSAVIEGKVSSAGALSKSAGADGLARSVTGYDSLIGFPAESIPVHTMW